jgi:hypothetical protein
VARPFTFRGEVNSKSRRVEAVFVYVPICKINSSDIERALTSAIADGGVSPDLLVFVTPETQRTEVKNSLCSEILQERFNNLKRCQGIVLAVFDGSGEFCSTDWLKKACSFEEPESKSILRDTRNAGFSYLSTRDGVVTQAPPGAYFSNPPQGRRSYFIRAALMCRSSVEASFISFALLPLVVEAKKIYADVPNIIWVDTVSIAYIGYALADLAENLKIFAIKPEIRSFSSYGGLARTSPSSGEYPIFIVSASSSGGLANQLVAESGNRIDERTISTIIGTFDGEYPRLLYSLPLERRGPPLESVDTLREIRVSGEDFLFNPGDPKAIELKRAQLPDGFADSFRRIQGKGLIHHFKCFSANKLPKAFLLDGNALVNDCQFQEWVRKKSEGSLPASVKRIIYQPDEASKRMAQFVQNAIAPFYGNNPPVTTSVDELERLSPSHDENVAVIAAVAGTGMELMRITRALRTYQPNGSRIFLTGAIIARSYSQLAQFTSNLRLSRDGLTYAIHTWSEYAPATDAIRQYLERETEFLKRVIESNDISQPIDESAISFARQRLEMIEAQGIIHEGVPPTQPFVGLSGKNDAAFDIGDGFALWKGGVTNNRCPIDILFTVACWLQNAREQKSLPHEDRLDGGGFQQTVIAPDCFTRFTDAVIQAAILRCARDSELDYRASPALSARATDIVAKLIRLKEESVFEFLLSLALRRMRLKEKDLARVINAAQDLPNDPRIPLLLAKISGPD